MGVTFETKCWENDWEVLLKTDYLKKQINNSSFIDDPENPEQFISLAGYYAKKNKKQQLICLYQALYYAKKRNEASLADSIDKSINELLSEGVSVPKTSFIILSYNTIDYTRQCLDSIKDTISLDRCQVVVVDNASEDGSLEYLKTLDWITLVENHENRGFPGGCNDGIAVSEKDNDIYLLNSDTILLPNSLFWLKMGLYENESVGSTGSMSNYAGGGQMVQRDWTSTDDIIDFGTKNNVPMQYPYEYKMFLIGFSLLLKRKALDKTGLLDERFNPGNSEDLDICFRILKSGRVNLLCHNSFVVHFGNKSFEQLKKKGLDYGKVLNKNDKKLQDKMKIDIWDCLNSVKKVALSQIKRDRSSAFNILELDCGMGSTASLIRTIYPNAEYTGIEADKEEASYAAAFGTIIDGNLKKIDCSKVFDREQFDYIIYSSRADSETIENKYKPYLKSDGQIINDSAKPVLSISMLCNGKHKEETKKCLNSLQTIREQIGTEIVIVDTGCDEEAHELIRQYADQIIPFKWCDDFAKARNAGLKECTGEWFMFIDDDEWFEDATPIVRFFTSGEYKSYQCADYAVRNYSNAAGTEYEDFWAGRMVKRTDETHFEGKIHEFLTPLTGECKYFTDCYAHHYGYVYKDLKEHFTKAIRNIKPLLKAIEEDPGNIHWYAQLAQEYMAIGNSGKLADLCESMIKQLDPIDDPGISWARTDFYVGKLTADNNLYQYDQTIEDFNKYRKDRRNDSICQAAIYFFAVKAYYELKDYKNALRYAEKYLSIYDKWQLYPDTLVRFQKQKTLLTRNVFSEHFRLPLYEMLINSGIKSGDIEILHKYFDKLAAIDKSGEQFVNVYPRIIDVFADYEFDERFVKYADTMLAYKDSATMCSAYARGIEKKNQEERFKRLIDVYGRTKNGDNYFLLYLRFRYAAEINDQNKTESLGKELIQTTNDFFNLDKSVWQIAEEKKLDLKAIFDGIPFLKWYYSVEEYMNDHDKYQSVSVRKMMEKFSEDDDVRFRHFRLKTKESDIVHDTNKKSAAGKLEKYCNDCVEFYKSIFSKEQFEGDTSSTMLPMQCQFAVRFLDAISAKSSSEKYDSLEKCKGLFNPLDNALAEYINEKQAEKKQFVFILYSAASWVLFDGLWETVDKDPECQPIVISVPYYDKKDDGTLDKMRYEGDDLPEKCHVSYFADVDLKKMHPDVIFINSQMDGSNPDAALPAEYYSDRLQQYATMLVYLPVSLSEQAAQNTLSQIKEQLKKM